MLASVHRTSNLDIVTKCAMRFVSSALGQRHGAGLIRLERGASDRCRSPAPRWLGPMAGLVSTCATGLLPAAEVLQNLGDEKATQLISMAARIHGWMQHWNLCVPGPRSPICCVPPGGNIVTVAGSH
jgi:hypothetical protein